MNKEKNGIRGTEVGIRNHLSSSRSVAEAEVVAIVSSSLERSFCRWLMLMLTMILLYLLSCDRLGVIFAMHSSYAVDKYDELCKRN